MAGIVTDAGDETLCMGVVLAEAITFDPGDLILLFLFVIVLPALFTAAVAILVAFGGYSWGLKKLKAPQVEKNYEPVCPRKVSPLLLATPLVLGGVGWAGRLPLLVLDPQLPGFLLVPVALGAAFVWGGLCARIELNRKALTPRSPEASKASDAEGPPGRENPDGS